MRVLRLKEFLEENNVSTYRLAQELDLNESSVYKYVSGQTNSLLLNFVNILLALGRLLDRTVLADELLILDKVTRTDTPLSIKDAKLTDLIDTSNSPIYLTDENLNLVYCNRAFLYCFNIKFSEYDGLHVSKLVERILHFMPEDKKVAWLEYQNSVIKDGQNSENAEMQAIMDYSLDTSTFNNKSYTVNAKATNLSLNKKSSRQFCYLPYGRATYRNLN